MLARSYQPLSERHSIICQRSTAVYNPKAFFLHAASLHQAFAHCGIFSTAASRRSTDRVSVPSLGIGLSPPLPVIALVGRYPTNKLIGPRPIPKRLATLLLRDHRILPHLSVSCVRLRGTYQGVTNSFATIEHINSTQNPYCYFIHMGYVLDRSTCMPYPRRQRSSWTRIKSSVKRTFKLSIEELKRLRSSFYWDNWKTLLYQVNFSVVKQRSLPSQGVL